MVSNNRFVSLVATTRETIRCWYESWDGEVYVAFSGGKDSTVLLHLVREMFPEVRAVFSNTGLEFPEIVKFAKSFDNVTVVRPKKSFKEVIDRWGWPIISKNVSMAISRYRNTKRPDQKHYRLHGRVVNGKKYTAGVIPKKWKFLLDAPFNISSECCQHLKKNPLKKFAKISGLKPMIGIMSGDSNNRKRDVIKRGCNVYDAKDPQSRPLANWTEKDIYRYIKENNIEICSVYSMGYDRTGCIFCMYGLHQEQRNTGENRFQKMKRTHPKLYDFCINKLGAGEVLDFIQIPYGDSNEDDD